MHKKSSFDIHALRELGIDYEKCDIIKFIIDSELLDSFGENEHFYYWSYTSEKVLSDAYNFINKGPYAFRYEDKDYDLNSFDSFAQMVIDIKEVAKIDKVFSGPPIHSKREFMLRYSKKYKRLEYYTWLHGIDKNRNRDKYFVKHVQHSFFSIDERNNVRIYPNKRTVRYLSNKNAIFFKGNDLYKNKHTDFYLKLNRRLLNLHLKSSFYDSDEKFLETNQMLNHLPNKVLKGCGSMEDVINKITKNRPVPKILRNKFPLEDIVSFYNIVEYDEMDKIIKFLYEYHDFVDVGTNFFNVLFQYLCYRVGVTIPNRNTKNFDFTPQYEITPLMYTHSSGGQEIRDYIRMLSTLNRKVNLNIKSMKRLRLEHDELARKISSSEIPKINVKKFYPQIKSGEGFTVERIEDKKRLVAESDIQNHCVKTYATYINKGTCCIYSFLDRKDGRRYTLEVQVHKNAELNKQVFILNQIRGKFNSAPPLETLSRAVAVLKSAGIYGSVQDALNAGFVFPDKGKKGNPIQMNNDLFMADDLPF